MMIMWAVVGKLLLTLSPSGPLVFLLRVAEAGILVNALLMVFNLFPLLPLDGGRIIAGLLPNRLSYQWSRTEPYGMFVLLGLIITGLFQWWLGPLVNGTIKALYSALGF